VTFLLNLLTALAGAAVLAEIMARAGAVPAVFVRHIPRSALEECGVGFLLGIHAFGTLLLGLAACGLFRPVPLALFLLAAVAIGSCVRGWRRSAALAALGELPRPVLLMVPFLLAAAIPVVLGLVIPSLEQDSYEYHLAFGWRCLQTGKVTGGLVPYVFHLPLPVDLAGSLGLPFGEERVGQWVAAGCWLAAGLVFMGRLVREERTLAGFAGLLLPLAAVSFTYLMASGKNDIPAAACFVAGALLWRRGGSVVGALLLGCAVAGKFVYGPLVAMWVVVNLPGRRKLVPVLTAVVLPTLPWWVKTFLYTGNPIYPFGWQYIPSFGWDSMNDGAMMAHARGFFHPDALTVQSIPKGWFRHFLSAEPHQLVVVPILLALSATRRRTLAVLGGQFVTMAMGHMTRYLLPGGWLFDLMAVGEAVRLKGKSRTAAPRTAAPRTAAMGTAAMWVAIAVGAGFALWNSRPLLARWPDLGRTTTENLVFRLSTFGEALRAMSGPGGGDRESGRLAGSSGGATLCVGELRTYPLRGRVLFDGIVGETPIMWKLCRESRDEGELARRMRQLGVGRIFYNFMGAFWACDRYGKFGWGVRDVGLYRRYLASNCAEVRRISRIDENSGGFYLFTIGHAPAKAPPEADLFLPGTDSIFAKAAKLERARDFAGAARAYWDVAAGLPWYGHALNMAGHGMGLLRDYQGAMKLLKPGVDRGVADMANIPEYGVALLETGRPVEANPYLAQALPIFVNQYDPIRLNLAWTWVQKAMGELQKRRVKEAEVMLDTAEELLLPALTSTFIQYTATRKFFLAQVRTLKAEAALKRGDTQAARACLEAALEADPGGKMERDIRAKLDALVMPAGGSGWYEVTPVKAAPTKGGK